MKRELSVGSLHIEILREGPEQLRMVWQGRSDERDPADFLNPFLMSSIELLSNELLVCDFRKLEFINPSTIPPIIRMIKQLHIDGKSARIVYDNSSSWHTASFSAFRVITDPMELIEISGE